MLDREIERFMLDYERLSRIRYSLFCLESTGKTYTAERSILSPLGNRMTSFAAEGMASVDSMLNDNSRILEDQAKALNIKVMYEYEDQLSGSLLWITLLLPAGATENHEVPQIDY